MQYAIREVGRNGQPYQSVFSVPSGLWVARTHAYSETITSYAEYDEYDEWLENYTGQDYTESTHRTNSAVGPEPRAIVLDYQASSEGRGSLHRSFWCRQTLLVGTEPFGVVTTDTSEGQGLRFTSARQVHKDELGRRPQIAKPQIIRENGSSMRGRTARDRRRCNPGWVNLTQLAELAGLPALEMVRCYFAFSHQEYPSLQFIHGDATLVAAGAWPSRTLERLYWSHLTEDSWSSWSSRLDLRQVWVRSGWALAVLHMRHLGYTPGPTWALTTV